MPALPLPSEQICARCSRALPPGALECANCHALVHATQLAEIATQAHQMEGRREYTRARAEWLKALDLLPANAKQAEWIRANIERLGSVGGNLAGERAATPAAATPSWARRFGPLAPLLALLEKGK